MKAKIVPAVTEHLNHIIDNLRQADRDEIHAMGLEDSYAVTYSLSRSQVSWTGTIDDIPVCMFGVCSDGDKGRPWLYGTDLLEKHSVTFLTRCRGVVDKMLDAFPSLENWVYAHNTQATAWLEWLGFEMKQIEYINNNPFIRFSLEKKELSKLDLFQMAIHETEEFMLQQEQIHVAPVHRFAEGLYCRELTMPKDTVWVSRVHLHENFAFILTGSCTVVSELGTKTYYAPCALKTEAGTKRLLRMHEDCTWVTVHAIPKEVGQDIDRIEEFLAVDTLEEYTLLQGKKVEVLT